jgi:hypothetical protein
MLMFLFTHFMDLNISWLQLTKHGSFMHPLDHVQAEPEPEVQTEQTQVEASTNPKLAQGKPRCIPPIDP